MHVIAVNICMGDWSGVRVRPFCNSQQGCNALLLHASYGQSPYSLQVTTRRFVSLKGTSCQLTAVVLFMHAWHGYVKGQCISPHMHNDGTVHHF